MEWVWDRVDRDLEDADLVPGDTGLGGQATVLRIFSFPRWKKRLRKCCG